MILPSFTKVNPITDEQLKHLFYDELMTIKQIHNCCHYDIEYQKLSNKARHLGMIDNQIHSKSI